MLFLSQQHKSQAQKDVSIAIEKKIFLFTPTVNLFGSEMRVAEIWQV
jgi:hypothetical protein